jgi:hypothetical protein
MKLRRLLIVLFLLFPAHSGAPLPPSLPHSVCNRKKPPSAAGFLSRRLFLTPLCAHFLSCRQASSASRFLIFIIQTPSSL